MLDFVERLFLRLCGQYVKNFKPEYLKIGLTGTVTLKNIQINLDSFQDIFYPYKLSHLFFGCLHIDIPISSSGKYCIDLSDVLIILDRSGEQIDPSNYERFQKILQSWISFIFFLAPKYQDNSNGYNVDLENLFKRISSSSINLHRVHFRIEDHLYPSHLINRPKQNSMGFCLEHLSMKGPSSTDIQTDPTFWNQDKGNLQLQLLLQITQFSLYYDTTKSYGQAISKDISLEFVQDIFTRCSTYHSDQFNIIQPVNSSCAVDIICKDKRVLAIGPVRIRFHLDDVHVSLTDMQLAFIWNLINSLLTRSYDMQLRCRFAVARGYTDPRKRAQFRWTILKQLIQDDIIRAASNKSHILYGGSDIHIPLKSSTRWRVWFQQWRNAARYVAVRDILCPFIGMNYTMVANPAYVADVTNESSPTTTSGSAGGENEQIMSFDLTEALYKDILLSQESGQNVKKYHSIVDTNMSLFQIVANRIQDYLFGMRELSSTSSDAKTFRIAAVARTLYAIQLQLDCMMPLYISIYCRCRALARTRARMLTHNVRELDIWMPNTTLVASIPKGSDVPVAGSLASLGLHNGPKPGEVMAVAKTTMSKLHLYCAVVDVRNISLTIFDGMSGKKRVVCDLKIVDRTTKHVVGQLTSQPVDVSLVSSKPSDAFFQEIFMFTLPRDILSISRVESSALTNYYLEISFVNSGFFAWTTFGSVHISLSSGIVEGSEGSEISQNVIDITSDTVNPLELDLILTPAGSDIQVKGDGIHKSEVFSANLRLVVAVVSTPLVDGPNAIDDAEAVSSIHDIAAKKLSKRLMQYDEEYKELLKFQHANNNANDDSGNKEQVMILDPNSFALHGVKIEIRLNSVTVCLNLLYSEPNTVPNNPITSEVKRDDAEYAYKCVLWTRIDEVIARTALSTSPIECSSFIQCRRLAVHLSNIDPEFVTVSLNDNDGHEVVDINQSCTRSVPKNMPRVICLNLFSSSSNLTQVSTRGSLIGEKIDRTCFEISGYVALGPFRISFRPKPTKMPSNLDSTTLLWKTKRILQHMWSHSPMWAEKHQDSNYHFLRDDFDNKSAKRKIFRVQGDWFEDEYLVYPKVRNVLEETLLYTTHSTLNSATTASATASHASVTYPQQQTHVSLFSQYRTMDFQFGFLPKKECFSQWLQSIVTSLKSVKPENSDDDDDEFDVFSSSDHDAQKEHKPFTKNSNDGVESVTSKVFSNALNEDRLKELESRTKYLEDLLRQHQIDFE